MEETLDFKALLCMLRAKWIWIVLTTIVGALCAFCVSAFLLTEQFAAETMVRISNAQADWQGDTISTDDLLASQYMADTCRIVLTSPRATDLLEQKLSESGQLSGSALASYAINISVVEDTEILAITVTGPDPSAAALVCNTMADVAEELVAEIFDGGRAVSLGEARPNHTPVSPNTRTHVIVGAALGLLLSCTLTVFFALIDPRTGGEAEKSSISQNRGK